MNPKGAPLEPRDYEALAARWIDREYADRSLLRRVDTFAGGELVGRNGGGRYEGIAIPYVWPGEQHVRDYRLRRDHPEFENGKPMGKYMAPPGRSGLLYFAPGTAAEWLTDVALPVVVIEGEFKTVALFRAANCGLGDAAERPRFLPVGLSGVWNWRGTIGKTVDETGTRVDEKGPIPDLARIEWAGRSVTIAFDRDVQTNEKVQMARALLAKELRSRGSVVKFFAWPPESPEAKGIDDLLAARGPEFVLPLIEHAPMAGGSTAEPKIRSVSEILSIKSYAGRDIEFVVHGQIAAGTVAAFTGDSGSGKSTYLTALGGAVSRGKPFGGHCTQKRPVLILDRENPLPVVLERFDRLGVEDGPDFILWGGWCDDEAPMPHSPMVLAWVSKCDPKPLIIVDSFIAFHEGSENDSAEIRLTMHGFRKLADLGATVVLIHHSGKGDSSKEYRGSSDFKAGIDVGYVVANLSGDPSRLGPLRLKAFKSRFIVEPHLMFQYRDGRFEIDERGPVKTIPELLRDLLIQNAGIRGLDFEAKASDKMLGRNQARAFLDRGVLAGTIRVDKRRHNTSFYTWIGGEKDDSPEGLF